MQQGDWAKFGAAMEGLRRLLAGPAQIGLNNPGNPNLKPGISTAWDPWRCCRLKGPDESDGVACEFTFASYRRPAMPWRISSPWGTHSCKPEVLANVYREHERMLSGDDPKKQMS